MKKRIAQITSALVFNGLLFNLSYAHYPSISDLATQCQDTATHLRHLVQIGAKDHCSGDIESVASTLETAGRLLTIENLKRVLVSVKYAALELNEIQNNRSYCHHYSSLITPVLDRVKNMGNEVGLLTQYTTDYLSS